MSASNLARCHEGSLESFSQPPEGRCMLGALIRGVLPDLYVGAVDSDTFAHSEVRENPMWGYAYIDSETGDAAFVYNPEVPDSRRVFAVFRVVSNSGGLYVEADLYERALYSDSVSFSESPTNDRIGA